MTINGLLERHFLQINKTILEWVKCDLLPDPNSQWTSKPIWRLHKIDPKYKRHIYLTNKNITPWVIRQVRINPFNHRCLSILAKYQCKYCSWVCSNTSDVLGLQAGSPRLGRHRLSYSSEACSSIVLTKLRSQGADFAMISYCFILYKLYTESEILIDMTF